MKGRWSNTPSIGLFQYRGEDWPLVGGFAVGLLTTSAGDWDIERDGGDDSIDIELTTPLGGLFAWVRFW